MSLHAPRRARQRGTTLIEILISVLIVSFGLLALAASQAAATRVQRNSEMRSVASLLAADIADRIRANAAVFDTLPVAYDRIALYAPIDPSSIDVVAASACMDGAGCSDTQIAALDMAVWLRALASALPEADAFIRRDTTAGAVANSIDLWIMWREQHEAGDLAGALDSADAECPTAIGNFDATNPRPRCHYVRIAY